MEKHAINKKMLKQLSLMNNHREPSTEILDSLYAQMVLEVSLYYFQKSRLMKEIDTTLENGDKDQFTSLVDRYNELLLKYKDGITLTEQEFQFTMKLED